MATVAVAPALDAALAVSIRTALDERPISEADNWELKLAEESWSGPGTQVRVRAIWRGAAPTRAGLVVTRCLGGRAPRRVLVPAVFYGDNGVGGRATRYPRLGPLDPAAFTAPAWDFAAARTALPAVFAWCRKGVAWLATEPHGTGVGFSLDPAGEPELRVHRPGLERPFRHDRADESPAEPLLDVPPGGVLELTLWYGDEPADDPEAYAPVQRALQHAWGGGAGREVDIKLALAAADAAAEGLLRWHYRPDLGGDVLVETVSFDGAAVRDEMHVAWLSGAPTAYALLRHGLSRSHAPSAGAARGVLDTVASGLAPCGAFWGVWTPRGWLAGWNGDPRALHARTLSEATLFLVRALALEPDHPNWAAAARSNLDFCLRALDERGNPGSYYDAQTGEVLERRGTAGLLWAATLAEGAAALGAPAYLAAAKRVGACYADAIRAGDLYGAPEDVGLCPSSEDGYNALIAMMALYTATGEGRWLALAREAADWLLTFRWSYDERFPADSPLARRGFRTRGADGASPSNHHLHSYGLICQRELRRLSVLAGDPWYDARAADHLACFLGEVAQRDGQFGGPERRGMMGEQWYTADWSTEGRAGDAAPVSHAWCLGLLLLAAEDWADRDAAVSRATVEERVRTSSQLRAAAAAAGTSAAVGASAEVLAPRGHGVPSLVVPGQPHPVRLLPGLYQVGGGYLSHPRDAASYLLIDEMTGDCMMLDCGSHDGLEALKSNVARVADLNRLRLVIGTHGHWDHVEGFGHLREETPALFAIHHLDARAVRVGDPNLTCAGFLYNEAFHAFPVDILLRGGERFHLGEFDLEILHLPGHSPGCIGVKLHYAGTGQTILVPGDSVQGGFGKRIRSSVPTWRRSMRRLMQEPLDFMLPSHLPNGAQTSLLGDVPNRIARVYSQLQTDFHAFMDAQRD